MNVLAENRLPGVYVASESPPVDDVLPRMDVAAFVGFAASGPIDIPVPVEDEVAFRELFGPDLALARDTETGEMETSFLGLAVRSFFTNGGRRCWILRVARSAGDAGATSNRFPMPGLARASGTSFEGAIATARSEGSWSDELNVGTTLASTVLDGATCQFEPPSELRIRWSLRYPVAAGDLLRLRFESAATTAFLAVRTIETAGGERGAGARFEALGRSFWFAHASPDSLAGNGQGSSVADLTHASSARYGLAAWHPPDARDPDHRLFLRASGGQPAPRAGSLLAIETAGAGRILVAVRQVRPATDREAQVHPSPPGTALYRISAPDPLRPLDNGPGQLSPAAVNSVDVERLRFDLWVSASGRPLSRIRNLGFTGRDERFVGHLPTDAELFGSSVGAARDVVTLRRPAFWQELASPRFPLSCSQGGDMIYLPLGMDGPPSPRVYATASGDPGPATVLERNGLTLTGAEPEPEETLKTLFVRAELAEKTTASLGGAIFFRRHVRGEALTGIHALWPVPEISLLAVPDAVHRPWLKFELPAPLGAPTLEARDSVSLSWTRPAGAITYLLQESEDVRFRDRVAEHRLAVRAWQIEKPHWDRPRVLHYRVRAASDDQLGPWSGTVRLTVPRPSFRECVSRALLAPSFRAISSERGRFVIQWREVEGAEFYTLQESTDPGFASTLTVYEGPRVEFEHLRRSDEIVYYRVGAGRGTAVSPWSEARQPDMGRRFEWRLVPAGPGEGVNRTLVELHHAMLVLARARKDLLAVLVMPRFYRERESLSHRRALESLASTHDDKALGHGALYHPWVFVRSEAGPARIIPPDGPVVGSIASRTIRRGAWIAPANEPMRDIVALASGFDRDALQRIFVEQVNLVRDQPGGFMLQSADTLSADSSLRPINVRRLLALLCRVAVREGTTLVFEPNNETFRDLVQSAFEGLLSDLYVRGAFAGTTPEQAYRVVTDESVNPRTNRDLGRFVVELRVAPSRPMQFILVRLIHGPGEALRVGGI